MKFISLFYFAFIAKFCKAGWLDCCSCCCGSVEGGEALDISNPDLSIVDIKEDKEGCLTYKEFKPQSGSVITSVVDGETQIWKDKGRCKRLILRTAGNDRLLYIEIKKGKCKDFRYYEKKGDEWSSMKINGYFDKLNTMKNGGKKS
ncbi:signal peptide containing protein [Theileria equi strain WA]|uniref:Signal peptide containing protein n=1 Tax=Theileria equi strain WA TaxID=1537102 RepID=L1LE04_THEEQ|nr:signal peptide containing protein [Theileria equi strain WA]EKX73383.1 signal peptide containing protein [Theileria equi strain WA]|eukprot:XP_004832835.1 signal peptide containing protein [Theileria equi strain WA]